MIKSVGKTNGYQTNNMIHANKRPPKTINQNTKRNTISYSHIEKKNTNPQETTQKKERKKGKAKKFTFWVVLEQWA